MSEIPNRKNRGQRNFLCPLFIPIPHRSCSCLKAIAVRDHHAVRTSGAMHHQQAAQPAVACGDADVFILRIEQHPPGCTSSHSMSMQLACYSMVPSPPARLNKAV